MNTPIDPGPEPSVWCVRHQDGPPDGGRCGDCIEARQWWDEWALRRRLYDAETTSRTARERADLERAEAARCPQCHGTGYVGPAVCRHNPGQAETNTRGIALARAALAQSQTPTLEMEDW